MANCVYASHTQEEILYTASFTALISWLLYTLLFPRDPLSLQLHPSAPPFYINCTSPQQQQQPTPPKKKRKKKCIDVIIGRRPRVDCVGARRQMSLLKVTHIIYRQDRRWEQRERGQGGRKERRQSRERAGWLACLLPMYVHFSPFASLFLFFPFHISWSHSRQSPI